MVSSEALTLVVGCCTIAPFEVYAHLFPSVEEGVWIAEKYGYQIFEFQTWANRRTSLLFFSCDERGLCVRAF